MKTALLTISLLIATQLQTDKGSVTGRVRSADGTPAARVRVTAMVAPEPGVVVTAAGAVMASLTQTDAAGNYRLENIPPGRYYITAGFVDFPTYYPGSATSAGATVVVVKAGVATANIDFPLARTANALKVSGRVTGATSTPGLPGAVALLPRTRGARGTGGSRISTVSVAADGTFEFSDVLPGTYSIQSLGQFILRENPVITVSDKDVTGIELAILNTNTVTRQVGFEQIWSLEGTWRGLASNEKSHEIYASKATTVAVIDAAGKILREFPGNGALLRQARVTSSGDLALVAFGTWSANVTVYNSGGQMLWSYPDASETVSGIDDVWPVDLDGDNVDEIVIGFNGSTGVRVLDAQGKMRWQSSAIGNVWHVDGGKVKSDGSSSVVTTSAGGQVHVFTSDGATRVDLAPGFYANMVRVGRASTSDTTETILAAGSSSVVNNDVVSVAALSATGSIKWSGQIPSNSLASVYSAAASENKPWFALGLQGGQVYVLDIATGAVLASIDGQGQRPNVSWISDGSGASSLVVSSENKLTAFKVTGPVQ